MILTIYARREPTQAPEALALKKVAPSWVKTMTDIALYKDKECTQPMGRIHPDASKRPRRNTRFITLNCWPWAVEWIKPLPTT